MIDFKELFGTVKAKATSPTALSWYGVAGVVATGVLTFLSTRKWERWKMHNQFFYIDEAEASVNSESDDLPDFDPAKAWENRPLKEKVKEVAATALIFTPPFAAAVGTSWCILHGNSKAMKGIVGLIEANNMQAMRLDKYKQFAAGALASEVKNHIDTKEGEEEPVSKEPHKLYFSDDDYMHEDYGKRVRFHIEHTGQVFESTCFEVFMAETEFNRLIWDKRWGEFGSLNELLMMLSVPTVSYGDYCGWSKEAGFDNGYSWVGFTHKKIDFDDGASGYLICFDSEPTYDELFERLIHG